MRCPDQISGRPECKVGSYRHQYAVGVRSLFEAYLATESRGSCCLSYKTWQYQLKLTLANFQIEAILRKKEKIVVAKC